MCDSQMSGDFAGWKATQHPHHPLKVGPASATRWYASTLQYGESPKDPEDRTVIYNNFLPFQYRNSQVSIFLEVTIINHRE